MKHILTVVCVVLYVVWGKALTSHSGYDLPDPFDNNIIVTNQDTVPKDRKGDFVNDPQSNPFDLRDPSVIQKEVTYDPESGLYIIKEKVGDDYFRAPTYMTFEEYAEYRKQQQQRSYFQKLGGLSSGVRSSTGIEDPIADIDVSTSLIDRLFGGNEVEIKPQGNIDLTFGGDYQNVQNPILTTRQQRQGGFDFDMDINLNASGRIGEKLNLNFNYNTQANFDFENQMKLAFDSDQFSEDDIIKKIEAGHVNLPLRSSLIQGSQSLFGLKTELQFGRLKLIGIASQQKSQAQSIQLQDGGQLSEFEVLADQYDENRHFFLSHFSRETFESTLSNLPQINTLFTITKMEVWITNERFETQNVRDIVAIADLGEGDRMTNRDPNRWQMLANPPKDFTGRRNLPDNTSNTIYQSIINDPMARNLDNAVATLQSSSFQFEQVRDFEKIRARMLNSSEYTFNPQLGFISLNINLRQDQVLAVAYEYVYKGQTYQVGELTSETPGDPDTLSVLYAKLLKATSPRVDLPTWDLMMKNFYNIGAYQVDQEDFLLDVFYDEPGKGFKRFLPAEGVRSVPLITIFNLDNLNTYGDPQPDGIFDFVPGLTIFPQNGRIMFPVLEPFGSSLSSRIGDSLTASQFTFQMLYDSTITLAREFPELNRFVIRGEYKASGGGSDVSLRSFNVANNSVVVKAGAQVLQEGVHYRVDYNTGRVEITDESIKNSGVPIDIQYEDNNTFGFQNRTMLGLRAEYEVRDNFTIGSTIMRLFERPYTEKVNIGDDPINNGIYGLDINYTDEAPWLTKVVDALPLIQTKAPSSLSFQAEAAALRPGHSRAINLGNDKGGVVYLDDFEGSTNSLDLKTPYNSWVLASVPGDTTLFPEGRFIDNHLSAVNRAKLNWYRIDPSVDRAGCDAENPYLAQITPQEIFPERDRRPGFNTLFTFDLTYYPRERGSYNFDPIGGTDYSAGLRQDNGELDDPESRWAGVMRSLYTTDFEASNIEYIEFWLLDPFMEKCDDPGNISKGGKLYINLGNISEDIMKDSRKFFENGLPRPQSTARTDTTNWGRIPRVQPLTNAFDNDPAVRVLQDVGLDGLDDVGERALFSDYLNSVNSLSDRQAFARIQDDPSGDNFVFFDDNDFFDGNDGALDRYKFWNNSQGNSKASDQDQTRISSYTNIPDTEDLNRDNTLSESESYYQYEIPIEQGPDGRLAQNQYITDQVDAPGGRTWYRFKIPVAQYDKNVGGIQGFRSIRFMRIFLKGFDERITFRFGIFEFVRNQWRRYMQNLCFGDQVDDSAFDLNEVNVEEHSQRQPFNYLVPKGVQREQLIGAFPNLRQNEQSLALDICGLIDGCSKAVYKNVQRDLRTYERFKMFVHAESQDIVEKGDLSIFVRIGSDFKNNFYEYEIPVTMSDPAMPANDADNVWNPDNEFNFALRSLIDAKVQRNNANIDPIGRYSVLDPDNDQNTITVVGNPNLGNVRSLMIGLKNNEGVGDGKEICAEVWVNEMRVTGIDERGGVAGLARLDLQLADLGNISFAGNFSTIGWGAIDQQVNFRAKESLVEYDINANIDLHKFFGERSTLRIPVYAQFSNSTSTPQFDPYDEDILLKDKINSAESAFQRDSIRDQAIDQTTIKSINFTNVRKEKKNTQSKSMPWDISNFSVTYVYSEKDNHNPIIEKDVIKNHRGSLDYNYSRRAKYVEPFKNLIGDSKALKFLKDFNFNPLPNSFSFRTTLNRTFGEKTYRFSLPQFSTWFNKRFTWDREYQLQWDLSKSLKLNFSAENNAVIDEPDEFLDRFEQVRIDPKVRNDSIWTNLKQLGRNKNYSHNINISYNLPTRSFPILDWINVRAQVSNSYSWTARALNVDSLGNILQNSQSRNLTADLNFEGLYNKWNYLSKINGKQANRRTNIRRTANQANQRSRSRQDDNEREKKDRDVSTIEKILIRPLMALRRAKFTYSENLNSVVPGFTPTPELLGLSKGFEAPGWKYVLGWHPSDSWLDEVSQKGWISNSPFLNDEVIRNKTQRLDAQVSLEPFPDFKIDVNANRNFQENHSQFFRNCDYGEFNFVHQVPRDVGTFTISYLSLNAIFEDNFQEEIIPRFMELESTRSVLSGRLGSGSHALDGPDYTEGFGRFQTDVLIPSFVAVYNGDDPNSIETDVFDILPRPNWQVSYNGLNKLPWFQDFIASFSLTHGYQSTLTVSAYNTDVDYFFDDPLGTQNLNPLTANYYSRFEIPSVVITEQFAPLIGIDLKAKNGLSARYDYAKSRNVALNLTDYQVIESNSTSTTLGIGYTMQNVNIPFLTGNKKKRRTTRQRSTPTDQANQPNNQLRQSRGNDLTFTFDYTLRDDITINHIFDQSQNEPTRGLRSISINPSIDYQASDNLNLRLFVDYQRTEPYTSLSYPITSVRGGLTVRISLN